MINSDLQQITDSIESDAPCIPGTLIYNEGWLLRLALAAAFRGSRCLPFALEHDSRWFSEALLYSRFLPRFRGDRLAESLTHADAVVGQFIFGAETKTGVILCPQATQFVVCEAKMFSPLSSGTKHAPGFDQAVRNIACMAETLRRAGKPVAQYSSLGFYLFAPASQIRGGLFAELMNRNSMRTKLAGRVSMYAGEKSHPELVEWLEDWGLPLVERVALDCCPWESIAEQLARSAGDRGTAFARFYELCLKYNSALDQRDPVA